MLCGVIDPKGRSYGATVSRAPAFLSTGRSYGATVSASAGVLSTGRSYGATVGASARVLSIGRSLRSYGCRERRRSIDNRQVAPELLTRGPSNDE